MQALNVGEEQCFIKSGPREPTEALHFSLASKAKNTYITKCFHQKYGKLSHRWESILKQHAQFDIFASAWLASYLESGKTIYCREGCAGCCNLAVHGTWPEAVAVAGILSAQQATYLTGYINRLNKALPELTDLKSYLRYHRQTLGPCPFLNERGACSIYPMRPLSCRALLSTRPSAWCTVDFSELDPWDKQAYESSLDRQVVAWPSHYVAATQDLGRELEETLLVKMQQKKGWSLSGNFPLMVWLELNCQLSERDNMDSKELCEVLAARAIDSSLLLTISGSGQSPGGY